MLINCSRLFTLTNWLMYSFGSVACVGSWFCISVTSNVRKSFADIVAVPVDESSLPSLELSIGLNVGDMLCADVWLQIPDVEIIVSPSRAPFCGMSVRGDFLAPCRPHAKTEISAPPGAE